MADIQASWYDQKPVNMPHPNSQILLIINQESGLDEELSLTILRSLILCVHLPKHIYSKDDGAKVNQRGS
ncbi:MAG: hypothetical protein WAL24_08440 [Nitrososphaeraceae archaeon]